MSDAMLLVLMTFASYRLWRIPGNDEWPPSRRLREWIGHRAGYGEAARPTWSRRWWWSELQTMVECPWCLGFWVSGAVVLIVAQCTSLPMPLLWWFATSCGVGLIGSNFDG